jgi:hypothetical protein
MNRVYKLFDSRVEEQMITNVIKALKIDDNINEKFIIDCAKHLSEKYNKYNKYTEQTKRFDKDIITAASLSIALKQIDDYSDFIQLKETSRCKYRIWAKANSIPIKSYEIPISVFIYYNSNIPINYHDINKIEYDIMKSTDWTGCSDIIHNYQKL